MKVLRVLVKIICLPIVLLLTLIQLVISFIGGISGVIMNLFAAFLFLIAIAGYGLQVLTGKETIEMILAGFVLYLIFVILPGCISAGISAVCMWLNRL